MPAPKAASVDEDPASVDEDPASVDEEPAEMVQEAKPKPPKPVVKLLYDKKANPGIDMLDRALGARLTAENLADLGVVTSYCEKALELGLDEFQADVAKTLLATTLVQRAQFTAKAAFQPGMSRENWFALRTLALQDLEKAVKNQPNYPEALFLMTELHILPGGDRKAAIKALDQVLAVEGLDPQKYNETLTLRANLEEDFTKRQVFLDKAIAANPNNLDALRLRGVTLLAMEKTKEAKADLERAWELDSNNADTCEALATALVELGEIKPAEKMIKKLATLAPGTISPLTLSAQLNAQKKDLPAALDDLNRALELEPSNAGVLLLRAFLYHEMKLADQATADVKRVLEIRPNFDRARRFQIALLVQQGKLDETLEKLKGMREEQPDDQELLLQLAILHGMKKNSAEALKCYNQLLDKDAKNLDALEGRASVFLSIGKHAEAIADFSKALKLSPDKSEILNNLAWVLSTSPNAKLRDGKRAIELATKACELTEYKEAHILSTLAAAYAEAGDFKHAVEFSTKAVELGKNLEDPEIKASLGKELKSYQEKKPWRELLENGEPVAEKK